MAINGFGAFNPYQQMAPGGNSVAAAYASTAPAPMAGMGGDSSSFSPELGGCGMGAGVPANLNVALAINFGDGCDACPPEQKAAPAPKKKAKKKPGPGGPLNWSAMRAIAAGRLPGHAQISIAQQLKNKGYGLKK